MTLKSQSTLALLQQNPKIRAPSIGGKFSGFKINSTAGANRGPSGGVFKALPAAGRMHVFFSLLRFLKSLVDIGVYIPFHTDKRPDDLFKLVRLGL